MIQSERKDGEDLVQADSGATDSSEKTCPFCGDHFRGHFNRIFCTYECKENYHALSRTHINRSDLPDISESDLRRLLTYQPESGQFVWNVRSGRAAKGTIAGKKQSHGYIYIRLLKRDYGAHRLAWLWCYGHLPAQQLDHRNGDKTDNRISNLRLATNSENAHSRRLRPPSSGERGVTADPSGGWRAQIGYLGCTRHLGTFPTKEEAAAAYKRASLDLFGPFSVVHLMNQPSLLSPSETEELDT